MDLVWRRVGGDCWQGSGILLASEDPCTTPSPSTQGKQSILFSLYFPVCLHKKNKSNQNWGKHEATESKHSAEPRPAMSCCTCHWPSGCLFSVPSSTTVAPDWMTLLSFGNPLPHGSWQTESLWHAPVMNGENKPWNPETHGQCCVSLQANLHSCARIASRLIPHGNVVLGHTL